MRPHSALRFLILFAVLVTVSSCEKETVDPNQLGGETNLELTQVGQRFPILINVPGASGNVLADLKDSIVITRNDGGIVTMHAVFGFDTVFYHALEEELGVAALPMSIKHGIIDTYVKRFNAVLDTTDKSAMTATLDAKLKVTSEGIQEYVSSGGDVTKPFTIVKYDAKVGDTWRFTNKEGIEVTRTVAYRSTTDDYPIAFWLLKVIKVEETREDPLIEKITYVTNHKYGLVGVFVQTKAGKETKIVVYPPTL